VPIGGTQYYSRACRRYGYESSTLMYGHYHINKREDFDYYPESIYPRLSRFRYFPLLSKYLCFLWTLPRYDIHFHNFDGGLLRGTPLRALEIRLRHLAGGKVVVYPYGGDAQVPRRLHDVLVKHTLMRDYPGQARSEPEVEARLRHYTKHADFIYASNEAVDYLPYWDFLMTQMSAFDTAAVDERVTRPGELRGRYPDKKIVFHAPNHRRVKGTALLIEACEELRAEGRDDFELVIYEGRPNDVILQAMYDCDIVADQFILGSYALFALEGMALRKPVMCYLRPDLFELYSYYSWAAECPIVNTPRDRIKETLVRLLDDPAERERLGGEGRRYVERRHSLDAMGKVYDAIIRKVWCGSDELDAMTEFRGPVSPERGPRGG
jgi:glycosyltransferase involved in cell wall biosynthesis